MKGALRPATLVPMMRWSEWSAKHLRRIHALRQFSPVT